MNLHWIDWAIVILLLAFIVLGVVYTKSLMRSVADFLAAGRTAGRYLISVSYGIAGLGAISIVGLFEMNYIAGFSLTWWGLSQAIVILLISVSGWVVYRFRQTRSLTLPQFLELRYSRKFRIFAGIIAYVAGIVNFGIFPAVGARFFVHFCGLPQSFEMIGIHFSTQIIIMIFLLLTALYFVFVGGHIAVLLTNFFQGVFVNIVFVIIIIFFLFQFDWSQLTEALSSAPENASLINPYQSSNVEDYNFWYFFIGMIGLIYSKLSWQGTQAYHTSAKSAHEAKMGEVLGNWRLVPQNLFLLFIPLIAYAVMHHSEYIQFSSEINSAVKGIDSQAVQNQLIVPLVLTKLFPVGLMGAFAAVMLAAFISTHDTYLHSWGTIFIQDVIMPFRKKPFESKQHIKILRISIIGVVIFIFLFSLFFKQSEYIFLFFAVTGAIFAGGSGAVIIGGLYWKKGTTAAAWSAMITGSTTAVGGIVVHQIWEGFFINGQMFWGIAMGASSLVYILVSLLGKKQDFNLDKMLHRGKYTKAEEMKIIDPVPQKGWRVLGMGKEFTKGDKLIYIVTYVWTFAWVIVFIIGTVLNLTEIISDNSWMEFWYYYVIIQLVASVIVIIWFSIGGIKDVKVMLDRLKTMTRDAKDDGFVVDHKNLDET